VSGDDLEPVDLEPIDLEPIDLDAEFDGPDEARRRTSARFRFASIVLVVLVAVAVVGIGMTDTDQPDATPTTLTLPTDTPTRRSFGVRPLAPDRAPEHTVGVLFDALHDVGTGRFAAVVNDRFYVLDARARTARHLASLGLYASVEARSGNSLLVRTRTGSLLLGTDRDVVTDLREYRMALPARVRDRWWLVDHFGELRDSAFGRVRPIPDGIRLIGEFANGFLVLGDDGYAVWDGTTAARRPLAIEGAVLAADDVAVVTRFGCSTTSCAVDIFNDDSGSRRQFPVSNIPNAAAFSASRSYLALVSTRSEVTIVDMQGAPVWFNAGGRAGTVPPPPFSWTTNTDELLVVEQNALVIWRGPDAPPRTVVGVPGLEQIVALL
jgi:hypothetical protein